MDPAYQSGCNCAPGAKNSCSCQQGYKCCFQQGNENVFGLCVKEENGCNTKTGLAMKKTEGIQQENFGNVYGGYAEGYSEGYAEGYLEEDPEGQTSDCDCKDWKDAMMVMAVIILLVVAYLIYTKLGK